MTTGGRSERPPAPDTEARAAAMARAAAIERFDRFAEALERISLEAFRQLALPVRDEDDRARMTREAEAVASSAGILDILERARDAAGRHVVQTYDQGIFRPTMVGLNWGLSDGTSRDRLAVIQAVQDAAVGAVLGPLAPPQLLEDLFATYAILGGGPVDPVDRPWSTADLLASPFPGPVLLVVAVAIGIVGVIRLASGDLIGAAFLIGAGTLAGVARRKPAAARGG